MPPRHMDTQEVSHLRCMENTSTDCGASILLLLRMAVMLLLLVLLLA